MSSTSTMPLLPCLAYHSVKDRSTVLFSVPEKKPITGGETGALENMTICPTARGFLLVRDPTSLATFLWSHQSRSKIELPPLPLDVDGEQLVYCNCLLSDEPTAPGCVVLLAPPDDPLVWFCRVGDRQWVKYEYDIGTQEALPDWDLPEEKVVICPIAACRGKFYFNGMPDSLGVIDFCGPAILAAEPFSCPCMSLVLRARATSVACDRIVSISQILTRNAADLQRKGWKYRIAET